MPDRIKKEEFIHRTATTWLDGVTETLYETFQAGESITLPGFGGFYVRPEGETWVFKCDVKSHR
jgi:nucleoid DNA-binding protein